MLISMPHGTSTIFGAFQAIFRLSLQTGRFRPRLLNYPLMKSSPAKSFVMKLAPALLRRSMVTNDSAGRSNRKRIKGFFPARVRRPANAGAGRRHQIKNL
jgi:hypothetical protein